MPTDMENSRNEGEVSVILADSLMGLSNSSLEKRDPAKAMLALEMLSGGEKWEAVQEATGYSFDQISRIRSRHKMAIEKRREELAQDGFEMAEGLRLLTKMKMEQLANNPDALAKTNVRDLVLPWKLLFDAGMEAMGEQRTIIEHRTSKPSLEDAMKAIEEARARVRGDSVDVFARPVQVVTNEIKKAE